jgi:hypothetical protein
MRQIIQKKNNTTKYNMELRIIDNWQTGHSKPKIIKRGLPIGISERPFRRGEKRIEALSKQWAKHVSEDDLDIDNQRTFIHQLSDELPTRVSFFKTQIKRKLLSYSHQDSLHVGVGHETQVTQDITQVKVPIPLTIDDIIHKLRECHLTCFYCHGPTKIWYETVRDAQQWTLERINNGYSHTNENTVIACLQCNLKRRCLNMDKYRQSHTMTVGCTKIGE